MAGAHQSAEAQLSYTRGQGVVPAYEGYEVNPDGSFNLLFGYMNRNWEEELDVPVGPDNYFAITASGGLDDLERDAYDPATADRGQPTHFLPRRNRFTFKVRVPASFGEQELVWTLRFRGETFRAWASLRQDLLVDNMIIASETGALGGGFSDPDNRSNMAPVIALGTSREIEAQVGQPVTLIARVSDDGLPITQAERRRRAAAERAAAEPEETEDEAQPADEVEPAEAPDPELLALRRWLNQPRRITVSKVIGLHLTWFVYRGENHATFDPIQIQSWEDTRAYHNSPWSPFWRVPPPPQDGEWVVDVQFDEPGTYVLRARADDGALYSDQEVTVHVRPLVR